MFKWSSVFIFIIISMNTFAQDALVEYGDSEQPGTVIHREINSAIAEGIEQETAVESIIASVTAQENTIISSDVKSALTFDQQVSQSFFNFMVDANSLIEVVKVLSEENPDNAALVITLGAVLYPEYVQEVYDGAALAGMVSSDEILLALIEAGVDPSTISDATAAGAAPGNAPAIVPLGAGIGSGGTGGGDTTASTN